MPTFLSPEKVLRVLVILCLASMGAAMISVAYRPGAQTPEVHRARGLIWYFAAALLLYGLFYLQYSALASLLKVQFNPGLGYLQALGSFSILLIGAVGLLDHPEIINAQIESGALFHGYFLVGAAILGEAVFLGNVLWTYLQQPRYEPRPLANSSAPVRDEQPARVIPRRVATPAVDLSCAWSCGWPKSPVHLFGITAGLLLSGGLVVLLLNAPSFKLLLPWPGPPRFVSMGVYLWIGASPLAFFALLYWLGGGREGLQFNDKLNRFHFWVAIIALIDSVRLAGTWVMSQVSTQAASYLRSDTLEVGGLLLLALGICITNIGVSRRTSGSTLTVRSRTR